MTDSKKTEESAEDVTLEDVRKEMEERGIGFSELLREKMEEDNLLEKEKQETAEVLDPTCGGRTIWYEGQKHRDDVLYLDKREEEPGFHGQEGRSYGVQPDEVQDFRDLPYEDESFNLIVWDPPHEVRENGMESLTGFVTKKYGCLHAETWQSDLNKAFKELWRVLRPGGTLVFKFSEISIDFQDVLDVFPKDPLFGTVTKRKQNENRWFVFYKPEGDLK